MQQSLVGFKPSAGRIPLDGAAELSHTFDTLGPLARTVADAALVTDVMAGDPPGQPVPDLPRTLGYVPLRQLDPVEAEISVSYATLLARLRDRGHALVPVTLPRMPAEYQALNGRIVAHEVHARLGGIARDTTLPLDPHVRQRVLQGASVTAADHATLLAARAAEVVAFHARLAATPVLLMPTTPIPARRIDEVDEATIPLSRYTRLANYLDLVAISLPMRDLSLPAGVQVMGPAGTDANVIAAALALEAVMQEPAAVLV